MKTYNFVKYGMIALVLIAFTGCQPSLTKDEKALIGRGPEITERKTDYREALKKAGKVINKGPGGATVVVVWPLENHTGAETLPPNMTTSGIVSVDELTGEHLRVVLYDPAIGANEKEVYSSVFQRLTPNFGLRGAVTGYDQNISKEEAGFDFNLYVPLQIKDVDVDTDLMLDFSRAKSVSRITVDLYLVDFATMSLYPGLHVSNTALVWEIEKDRGWGILIYGSGVRHSGRLMVKHGEHQAVRNLLEYSVLQLFSMYYSIPYWKFLGYDPNARTQELLSEWREKFLNLDQPRQVNVLQRWLMRYDLGSVYVNGTRLNQIPETEYGIFSKTTQGFTLKYLYQYDPDLEIVRQAERSNFPQNKEVLGELYLSLINHVQI